MQNSTIDLIRHGEPVGGIRFRGQMNDVLSKKGWAQMDRAVNGNCAWDAIISSPLARCSAFAEQLSVKNNLPLEIESELREIGFGEWEGRTADQIGAESPEALAQFYRNPQKYAAPGGEPFCEFRSRVTRIWSDLIFRYQGKHILLVCHGGVIRVIVAYILGMPSEYLFRLEVDNASITRIGYTIDGGDCFPRLIFHGRSFRALADHSSESSEP